MHFLISPVKGGFKSMESYHLFFVDVFVKPSCSLPDPEPLNAIEISISSPPPPSEVPMHNVSSQYGSHLVSDVNQAQEKLLDGRPSSVGEFSHIGQFQVGVLGAKGVGRSKGLYKRPLD